jgi:Zn-dependent protease with chaperone function
MRTKLQPCLGIPVYYDPKLKNISDSRGIWRWKKIVVGPSFNRLDDREAGAVLLHEAGHCKLRHLEKRLKMLWLVLISPQKLLRICLEQEFEADRFAARCGYGNDLIRLFHRLAEQPAPFHPKMSERIARLAQGE